MIFTLLLFLTAISLSAVAAYYSVVGLIAIFPTAVVPIAIMGITLEVAKLVSASWLYRNWKSAEILLKYYFTASVVILSFITSMGIFGFLSKAHIDQTTSGSSVIAELSLIDEQIKSEKQKLDSYQRSLSSLDKMVENLDVEKSVAVRSTQTRERNRINQEITNSISTIQKLNEQALPLRKDSKKIISEVGPIKFIADLLFTDSSENTLEKAVRYVIILIVIVFDPLAIVLLIAANRELNTLKQKDYFIPSDKDTLDLSKVNLTEKKKDKTKIHEIPPEILDKVFKGDKTKKK